MTRNHVLSELGVAQGDGCPFIKTLNPTQAEESKITKPLKGANNSCLVVQSAGVLKVFRNNLHHRSMIDHDEDSSMSYPTTLTLCKIFLQCSFNCLIGGINHRKQSYFSSGVSINQQGVNAVYAMD